jgi:hypothetical protein
MNRRSIFKVIDGGLAKKSQENPETFWPGNRPWVVRQLVTLMRRQEEKRKSQSGQAQENPVDKSTP